MKYFYTVRRYENSYDQAMMHDGIEVSATFYEGFVEDTDFEAMVKGFSEDVADGAVSYEEDVYDDLPRLNRYFENLRYHFTVVPLHYEPIDEIRISESKRLSENYNKLHVKYYEDIAKQKIDEYDEYVKVRISDEFKTYLKLKKKFSKYEFG